MSEIIILKSHYITINFLSLLFPISLLVQLNQFLIESQNIDFNMLRVTK